ncbi:MAG: acyl-CoA dehydrogenase [bacterium]
MQNPLFDDRFVDFLLDVVHPVGETLALPAFAEHDRETCALYLDGARRFAREVLWPSYRPMDAEPPVFEGGRVRLHPLMKRLYPRICGLGVMTASRDVAVGGHRLPRQVAMMASSYLMAGNLSAVGLALLTAGAGHLVEVFGDETVRGLFLGPMYDGRWTGTMALTEPQAGSSLADLSTAATPRADGTFAIRGSKIFISGADHDVAENVVHLTLARIDGAPAGSGGISLFAVPRLRPEAGGLVDNDVTVTQLIHKIGWRGLPSLGIAFGERGECRGWLVGAPGNGLGAMFQMMNEARIAVGAQGVATASAAYHAAVAYARERAQGRPLGARGGGQVAIIEHPDVRRMLLRQRAIVEGGLALVSYAARCADRAHDDPDPAAREHNARLLDVLTPIVKSFPAEYGFEACALAVQVHGGYGYTTEYLPEALLRDQKLNSIHEGTTGIQGLDLLGRKGVREGGAALRALIGEVEAAVAAAKSTDLDPAWGAVMAANDRRIAAVTMALAAKGAAGEVEAMLAHSHAYLTALSIHVVAWQWLLVATACARAASPGPFHHARRRAAQAWFAVEVPRVAALLDLCASGDDSHLACDPAWF